MIFPLAYLALTSSLTVLLIAVGLAGQAALAAELAVIQGALLATFYAFSANTRNLILQGHGDLTAERLLAKRIAALPLLGIASYLLCAAAAGVSPVLTLLLIARRSLEWLAEVRLCEIEVADEKRGAARAFVVQATVTLATAALLALAPQAATAALAVYAVSPLFASRPRLQRSAFRAPSLALTLRGAAPHIGSTAIEGISAYVLRLVVFLIAGPQMSGLLFAAFVLGSFIAALFANVLGPTLALRQARQARSSHEVRIAAAACALGALGMAIAGASLAANSPDWLGRPGYFWLALGLSLVGCAVMIGAQILRLRLFAERRGDALFGPDVLRHLTAIVAAPALYYLVAPAALGALYLATALLTLFFYWGAHREAVPGRLTKPSVVLHPIIAAALVFPLFFTLDGRVYRNPGVASADLGASLMDVPLPLSLGACLAGIVLLARYRDAVLALGTIFLFFVAMVLTSVVAGDSDLRDQSRKYILLFQFLLPMFGLALGQMFGALSHAVRVAGAAFVAVVALVVPVQLLRSIGADEGVLYHDLGLFSIYQHLEYGPTVFVCAYFVGLFALWDMARYRRLLASAAPLVGWYAVSSFSSLTVVLLAATLLVLLVARRGEKAACWAAALTVVSSAVLLFLSQGFDPPLPEPLQMRLHYWGLFSDGIFESASAALFGHARAIDRSLAPSAYNYYLDFVYNFGVLAFLPFAWLVWYTLTLLWRERARLRELPLLGLAAAVLFVLALDNMFKVPLRQPYSGVFFFFLWGLLLAQLQGRPTMARAQ